MQKVIEFIKSIQGMACMGLLLLFILTGYLCAANWNIPQTTQFPVWSGDRLMQIASGSSSGSITVDGRAYLDRVYIGTSHLHSCTGQVILLNASGQEYHKTPTPFTITTANDVDVAVSTPIAGITTIGISLSSAATTGGEYLTINLNAGRER
jgi:hypothetical protein